MIAKYVRNLSYRKYVHFTQYLSLILNKNLYVKLIKTQTSVTLGIDFTG